MKNQIFILFFTLFAFFLLFPDDIQAQCAMCKASVESSQHHHDQHRQVGMGLNKGILMLLGIPYLLLMFMLWYFFRNKLKAFFQSIVNIYPDTKNPS